MMANDRSSPYFEVCTPAQVRNLEGRLTSERQQLGVADADDQTRNTMRDLGDAYWHSGRVQEASSDIQAGGRNSDDDNDDASSCRSERSTTDTVSTASTGFHSQRGGLSIGGVPGGAIGSSRYARLPIGQSATMLVVQGCHVVIGQFNPTMINGEPVTAHTQLMQQSRLTVDDVLFAGAVYCKEVKGMKVYEPRFHSGTVNSTHWNQRSMIELDKGVSKAQYFREVAARLTEKIRRGEMYWYDYYLVAKGASLTGSSLNDDDDDDDASRLMLDASARDTARTGFHSQRGGLSIGVPGGAVGSSIRYARLSIGQSVTMIVDQGFNVVIGQFNPIMISGESLTSRTQLIRHSKLTDEDVLFAGAVYCKEVRGTIVYEACLNSGTVNSVRWNDKRVLELARQQILEKVERGEMYWYPDYVKRLENVNLAPPSEISGATSVPSQDVLVRSSIESGNDGDDMVGETGNDDGALTIVTECTAGQEWLLRQRAKVLENKIARLDQDGLKALKSMGDLAKVYRALNRFADAQKLHARRLDKYQQNFGQNSACTLQCRHELAVTLRAMGRHQEAKQHLVGILTTTQRQVAAEDDPTTLRSMYELAMTHYALNKYENAHQLHQQTWARQKVLLGEDHPDTLKTKNGLEVVEKAIQQMDLQQTPKPPVEETHKQLDNHPDTHCFSLRQFLAAPSDAEDHNDSSSSTTAMSLDHSSRGMLSAGGEVGVVNGNSRYARLQDKKSVTMIVTIDFHIVIGPFKPLIRDGEVIFTAHELLTIQCGLEKEDVLFAGAVHCTVENSKRVYTPRFNSWSVNEKHWGERSLSILAENGSEGNYFARAKERIERKVSKGEMWWYIDYVLDKETS